MTQILNTFASALVLGLAVTAAGAAGAHSLEEHETTLFEKEQYFQPLDAEQAPGFALRDADGGAVRLDDLKGKVVVLHFIYAGCPDVCPLHAEKIAEVQAMVNQTPMNDRVRFISITTDPVNDTPDVLREYGPLHGLDPVNWRFLTIAPDQAEDATRKLAEAYGHKFAKTDDGYQVHGVVTHVIDREGRWRANFHGLKFGAINLVTYVNALVNDAVPHRHPEPSWWEKVKKSLF